MDEPAGRGESTADEWTCGETATRPGAASTADEWTVQRDGDAAGRGESTADEWTVRRDGDAAGRGRPVDGARREDGAARRRRILFFDPMSISLDNFFGRRRKQLLMALETALPCPLCAP